MKNLKIVSIKANGFGLFVLCYADGTFETIKRDEMMFALNKGHLSEEEATAFKYADCIPNTIQGVS